MANLEIILNGPYDEAINELNKISNLNDFRVRVRYKTLPRLFIIELLKYQKTELVKYAILSGKVDIRSKVGAFLINIAIVYGNIEIVETLLEHPHFNVKNVSAEHLAICAKSLASEHFRTLKLMLEKFPELALRINRRGESMLFFAAQNLKSTKLLLLHGADPTLQDDLGKCACDYASDQVLELLNLWTPFEHA